MKCPKCHVPLELGVAIDYNENPENVCRGFGCPLLNAETIRLVDVAKCPKCGYSDDLK